MTFLNDKEIRVMKVAFVDLGKQYGGAENYILSISKAWIEKKNECIYIVYKNGLFKQEILKHVKNPHILEVNYNIITLINIRKRIKSEKIGLFQINGINSGLITFLWNLPIKRITTVHSNAVQDRLDKSKVIQTLFVCLENFLLKRNDRIIAVSNAIKQLLVKRGIDNEKIEVIPNGIKKINYTEDIIKNKKNMKICFIGRLEAVKGCEYLIKSLSYTKHTDITCDIYGTGSLMIELENLSKELNLQERICFKGFSNNIRDIICDYDIMVQPSVYEAFSLSLLEAMNAKTLVICSNVGGMKEIISHNKNGLLFEVGQSGELAKILDWCVEHPQEIANLREEAYKTFNEKYREEIMTDTTISVIRGVL